MIRKIRTYAYRYWIRWTITITARQLGCQREFHGEGYNGWTVCANHLSPQTLVYSIGVGEDISFDLSLINQYGVNIFAFDPTPRSIQWVKAQQLPTQFHLVEFGVAAFDGTATFFPPENPEHISHSMLQKSETADQRIELEVRRLSTLMRDLQHQSIDILKMDIEGAEYEVIPDMIESNIFPTQLLVEFHHRFEGETFQKTRQIIRLLRGAGYRIVSRSPSEEEYSFLRVKT